VGKIFGTVKQVVAGGWMKLYRVSIYSFPDLLHLLQENCCSGIETYFFFQNITQEVIFTTH